MDPEDGVSAKVIECGGSKPSSAELGSQLDSHFVLRLRLHARLTDMAQDDGKGTEEGYVAASHQSASLPLSSAKSDSNSVRGWLQGEINTDQTLMQFTGYCLLTGESGCHSDKLLLADRTGFGQA